MKCYLTLVFLFFCLYSFSAKAGDAGDTLKVMSYKNWKDLSNSELTYHTRKPEVKIDWIFAKPAGCIELLSADVKEDIMLSDHFPLISTIVISPEAYK